MKYGTTYLSVIVPAFNEATTIARTLKSIHRYLREQEWEWEVIVSADGTDGTRESARAFAERDSRFSVIGSPQRRGKGRGVRDGVLRAAGQVIGFLDADYKTPVEDIDNVLPWIDNEFDVVIGSRRTSDAQIEIAAPMYRRAGSQVFGLLMRQVMGLPNVRDTQCGFKFFTRSAARTLFSLQRIDGYMFDVEILRLCNLLKLRVKEVGVRWRDDNDSRYDPVAGTIKNMRELLRICQMSYELPAVPAAAKAPVAAARLAA